MKMESYIAVDLEMTGLNPKQDRIIEIGAVRVVDGVETESFHSLVNPQMHLPQKVRELTGITDEMVADAPVILDILESFLVFSGEDVLLGHNILFDYSFLKRQYVNAGYAYERAGIDTLKIARSCLPELESKSLPNVCNHLGICAEGNHRAIFDARLAAAVYERLKERFASTMADAFAARPLLYKIRKEGAMTAKQKEHLIHLIKYHRIEMKCDINSLTRNEASRWIDIILREHRRI